MYSKLIKKLKDLNYTTHNDENIFSICGFPHYELEEFCNNIEMIGAVKEGAFVL